MAKVGRGSDQFPLRLPDGLRDRIKAVAENNKRSMNAEIIQLISDGFEQREHVSWLESQYKAHEDNIEELERMASEHERDQKRLEVEVDVSAQLLRLEHKIEDLTKGLVVYGRAFELSAQDDQVRAMGMLEKAIDEVQSKDQVIRQQLYPRPTSDEWEVLRSAPAERQRDILEALSNVEIDWALKIATLPVNKKRKA